ncbi:MAG: prolyl oligopeptidase family serine peptidase [Asticcacaulis sp.]
MTGRLAMTARAFTGWPRPWRRAAYLVMQPNYRGSDGAGTGLRDAGQGEWGGKMQSDLDDGVHALVAQGLADPGRVCTVGIGYGGYAALTAAAEAGTYRCAVSINGISDLAAYADWQKSHQTLPQQDAMTSLIPRPAMAARLPHQSGVAVADGRLSRQRQSPGPVAGVARGRYRRADPADLR